MLETLLNWLVLVFSFAVLLAVAWVSFRDLRATAEIRAPRPVFPSASPTPSAIEPEGEGAESSSQHLLRVDYFRNGVLERTTSVTDERPGFVGTEAMRGMGPGVLVRHARLAYSGDRFEIENRHGSKPLEWRADGGKSGALDPGEAMPVDGEVDLLFGDWQVTCREEY